MVSAMQKHEHRACASHIACSALTPAVLLSVAAVM
jgi:hypothetical protein